MHGQVTVKEPFPPAVRAVPLWGRAPAPFRAAGQLFGLTKGNLQTGGGGGGGEALVLSGLLRIRRSVAAGQHTQPCMPSRRFLRPAHEGSKTPMCSATKPRLLRATGSCSWAAQRASNRRNERRHGPTGQQYTIPIRPKRFFHGFSLSVFFLNRKSTVFLLCSFC
jgi:hypothetical protein